MPILCVLSPLTLDPWQLFLDALDAVSPLVEDAGPGRAFLEMRGIPGLPREWFAGVRTLAAAHACSVQLGLARNPTLAYLAARHRDGTIVRATREAVFLAPLSITLLDLDAAMTERLQALGLRTFGQIAALPAGTLARRFGKAGAQIARTVCGSDERPLRPRPQRLEIDALRRYDGGIFSSEALLFALAELTTRVAQNLQQAGLQTGFMQLEIEDDNGVLHEIALPISRPTADATLLITLLRAHLEGFTLAAPIAGLRLRVEQLEEGGTALELLRGDDGDLDALALALARIHASLGGEVTLQFTTAAAHVAEAGFATVFLARQGFRPPRAVPLSASPHATLVYRVLPWQIIRLGARAGRPLWFEHPACRILEYAGPWRITPPWWHVEAALADAAAHTSPPLASPPLTGPAHASPPHTSPKPASPSPAGPKSAILTVPTLEPPTEFDEYDVVISDGRMLRVATDNTRWYLRGCYD